MNLKKLISCMMSIGLIPLTAYAAPYSGRVYIDANRNGRFDKGEKTLKDVMVSDGLHVVKTSQNGQYTLQGHSKERFLFITTPSGYKAVSHYHPIQNGKECYDFALLPYQAHIEKGAHRFVHISDTEISTTAGQEEWVADVREYAANQGAAFIVHTGDICYEKGLKAHRPMMNTQNMDIPVYYCIGNHDLVKGKYGEELFESIYGPTYYSFDVGNVHYIVTPMWGGDYRPSYTKEDVYYWMKNDLAQIPKERPIVIFNHSYWTTEARHIFSAGEGKTIDLDAHHLLAWIYGHLHINHITRHGNALAICTSTPARGGIDHATSAFRTLHIDTQGKLSSELRYTYITPYIEIASIQNGQAAYNPKGNLTLSANTYSTTSPAEKVVYSLQAEGKEIAFGALTQATDFNWNTEIKIPNSYQGQTLTLTAKVHFANGEVAETQQFFTHDTHKEPGIPHSNWNNLAGNAQHVAVCKDTLHLPFTLEWIQNTGSNIYMTSPIIYNKKVYIATTDENAQGKSAVVAMDAINGKIKWKYTTRASVKNTITTAQSIIFAQDAYGYLYALDAETGKLVWEKKLNVTYIPGLNDGLVASADKVFAGSGKGLCALDAKTGKTLWQNNEWTQREGTTSTLSLSQDEHILIGGVQWKAMYANNAHNGKLIWSRSENGIRNRASSPAIHGGSMYFLSLNSLFILSPHTGEILFRKELPYSVDVTSTPLVTEENIIFGTATEGLVALDRQTLEEKWRFRTGRALIYTSPYSNQEAAQIECSPILSGDIVLCGASDGTIYALDPQKGNLLWKHKTGAPIMSSLSVSGNMFFGADYAGNVYGFKTKQQ